MKRYTVLVALLVVGIFCAVGVTGVYAQSERDEEQVCSDMTYGQLAKILINILALNLPEGFEELAEQEQFEVLGNLFSEQGIPDFAGLQYNGKVTRGFAAVVLVKALNIEAEFASLDEQIAYLANLGYISRGGIEEILTDCDPIQAYTPDTPDLIPPPDPDPEPVSKVR